MRLQKNKDEQISVGHFCGKHAMGTKKTEMFKTKCRYVFSLGPPTEMRLVAVTGALYFRPKASRAMFFGNFEIKSGEHLPPVSISNF